MTGILKEWGPIKTLRNWVDEFIIYMEIMGVDRQQLTDPNGLVSAVYRDGTSHEKKQKLMELGNARLEKGNSLC